MMDVLHAVCGGVSGACQGKRQNRICNCA